MSQLHICGRCQAEFDSEESYVEHVCAETGFNPADAEHLGEEFKAVQEASLARGAERAGQPTAEVGGVKVPVRRRDR